MKHQLTPQSVNAAVAARDPKAFEEGIGEHPLGAGIGALLAGGTAGAAIGILSGPLGAGAGFLIGAIAGGLGGRAIAELVKPTGGNRTPCDPGETSSRSHGGHCTSVSLPSDSLPSEGSAQEMSLVPEVLDNSELPVQQSSVQDESTGDDGDIAFESGSPSHSEWSHQTTREAWNHLNETNKDLLREN